MDDSPKGPKIAGLPTVQTTATFAVQGQEKFMKQNQFLAILAICLFAGTIALPAVAGDSRGIEFLEESYSGFEPYVPCLNETVFESGVIRIAYHEFQTPSGTVHVVGNWKITNFWTGLNSGDEWVGQGNSPGQDNGKLDKGEVHQFVSNYQMKPLDSDAPPVKVQFRFKVTVNASGELVVDRFDASFRCLGSGK